MSKAATSKSGQRQTQLHEAGYRAVTTSAPTWLGGRRFALHPGQARHRLVFASGDLARLERVECAQHLGWCSRRRAHRLAANHETAWRETQTPAALAVIDTRHPLRTLLGFASLALSLLLGLVLGTLAALPYGMLVIDETWRDLLARAEYFSLAGEFFLPGKAVLTSMSTSERLASALIFAAPFGAALTLPVLALLLLDECERGVSGFAVPLLLVAAPLTAIVCGLAVEPAAALLGLVPLAGLIGYWLPWRWRTPGRPYPSQEAAGPRRRFRWALTILLATPLLLTGVVGLTVSAEGGNPFITVRDHWLLPSDTLRPLSDAYYRHVPLATQAVLPADDPHQFQAVWLQVEPDKLDQPEAKVHMQEALFALGFATVAREQPPPGPQGLAAHIHLRAGETHPPAERGPPEPSWASLQHLALTEQDAATLSLDELETRLLTELRAADVDAGRIAIAQTTLQHGVPLVLVVAAGVLVAWLTALGGMALLLLARLIPGGQRFAPPAVLAVAAALTLCGLAWYLEVPNTWRALTTLHNQDAVGLAEEALTNPCATVRSTALRRLYQQPAETTAQPWATEEFRNKVQATARAAHHNTERLYATALTGLRPTTNAEATLSRNLNDPSINVRYTAANALGHLGTPASLERLEQVILDPTHDWYVRQYAYQALLNAPSRRK